MSMSRCIVENNNLENNIGLVREFLNIWSDLKNFNPGEKSIKSSGNAGRSTEHHQTSTLDQDPTPRIERRLKNLGSRDVDSNLFVDYVGSYTIKKKGSKIVDQEGRQVNWKKRKLSRFNKSDSHAKVSSIVQVCNHESDNLLDGIQEKFDGSLQTKLLISFLQSNKILNNAPPNYHTDADNSQSIVNVEAPDIDVENHRSDDDGSVVQAIGEGNSPITDSNNNSIVYNVIDITNSSGDSDSEVEICHHQDEVQGDQCSKEILKERKLSDIEELSEGSCDEGHSHVLRNYKHPLEHEWAFWYFFPTPGLCWEENLRLMVTVSTIEDFWSVVNWVECPSSMKNGADFSLFKSGKKNWNIE